MVVKNAVWLSGCRFVADFSSLILFTVIARDLGPDATGQYSYGFALATFVSIVAASGLDQYGVRRYSQLNSGAERRESWQGMLAAQGLQLLLGVALLAVAALLLAGKKASPVVILELGTFLIAWGLSRTLFVPAVAHEQMVAPALMELLCRSAASLSALALCLSGVRSLPVLLIGFPVFGLVLIALAMRNARQHTGSLSLHAKWTEVVAIVRSTAPFTISECLGQFYIRVDLLLVIQLLGSASAGWYAADLKMVEVGVMPLILFGTAAYPVLCRTAHRDPMGFQRISGEFLRGVLFASGWLAVGLYCLVPLIVPALFGSRFDPAVRVVPFFAALALTKGLEIALYRLLFATGRQTAYLVALSGGTVLILMLNLWLIPAFGTGGAVVSVVLGSMVVNLAAIVLLRSNLPPRTLFMALVRLGVPLVGTAIVYAALDSTSLHEWYIAAITCLAFPAFGALCGLMPHPRRSLLFA